jgi:hypothetical protein
LRGPGVAVNGDENLNWGETGKLNPLAQLEDTENQHQEYRQNHGEFGCDRALFLFGSGAPGGATPGNHHKLSLTDGRPAPG